jgi:hypothetical protein
MRMDQEAAQLPSYQQFPQAMSRAYVVDGCSGSNRMDSRIISPQSTINHSLTMTTGCMP